MRRSAVYGPTSAFVKRVRAEKKRRSFRKESFRKKFHFYINMESLDEVRQRVVALRKHRRWHFEGEANSFVFFSSSLLSASISPLLDHRADLEPFLHDFSRNRVIILSYVVSLNSFDALTAVFLTESSSSVVLCILYLFILLFIYIYIYILYFIMRC